jgi:hypothetical protein
MTILNMKKIKITAGIIWAFACLILILILFPGLTGFSKSLAQLPFMKINPNYSGGEIAFSEIQPACTLVVRKPVFDGLLSERKHGFIQVDWRGQIPEIINDTIDYDSDNNPDFIITVNSASSYTEIESLNKQVKDINVSTPTSYGWAIRINIEK